MRTINITTESGRKPQVVAAEIESGLAIHREWRLPGAPPSKEWAVTHVASGAAILHRLSKAQARSALRVMVAAAKLHGFSWEEPRARIVANDHARAVAKQLRSNIELGDPPSRGVL